VKPLDLKTSNGSLGASVFKDRVDGVVYLRSKHGREKDESITLSHCSGHRGAAPSGEGCRKESQVKLKRDLQYSSPAHHAWVGLGPRKLGAPDDLGKGCEPRGWDEWEKASTGTARDHPGPPALCSLVVTQSAIPLSQRIGSCMTSARYHGGFALIRLLLIRLGEGAPNRTRLS
jgi:hypothetical protein